MLDSMVGVTDQQNRSKQVSINFRLMTRYSIHAFLAAVVVVYGNERDSFKIDHNLSRRSSILN